jgi:hypothetical protein
MHGMFGSDGFDRSKLGMDDVYPRPTFRYQIYNIGVSQSLVLSTGINLISDVVGGKAKTGAFVFGIYSLLDKFSSGIAIFMIGNSESYSK